MRLWKYFKKEEMTMKCQNTYLAYNLNLRNQTKCELVHDITLWKPTKSEIRKTLPDCITYVHVHIRLLLTTYNYTHEHVCTCVYVVMIYMHLDIQLSPFPGLCIDDCCKGIEMADMKGCKKPWLWLNLQYDLTVTILYPPSLCRHYDGANIPEYCVVFIK